jgi:tetratricopeptide (TPR) repeat protein
MAFVAALVVAVVALATAPGHAFYFDITPKVVALLVGTAVLLILAARRRESPRAPRLFTALLVLNGASLALSTALSANRPLSAYGGSWRCFGALVQCAAMLFAWLVARYWGTRVGVARLAAVLALAALIAQCERQPPWSGARRLLWRDTLSMAAKRPLAGFGPEVFLGEFPLFESKALAQAAHGSIYESPRNAFLDVLIAQGSIGLLALGGLCAAGLAAAWKRRDAWLAAALAAGIVGLQFTVFYLPTALLFLTAIALAVRLAEKPEAPRPAPVLGVVAPFVVLALLYLALRLAMADRELVLTRRLLAARDLRATTAEYETYWFWRLPGASADVWYSRSWMDVARGTADSGVRTQALAIADEAAGRALVDAEEPFLAWFNLAQAAILESDFDAAEQDLRAAIAAYPNWYLPHRALAQELLRQSRVTESQQETDLALELLGNARKGPPELR